MGMSREESTEVSNYFPSGSGAFLHKGSCLLVLGLTAVMMTGIMLLTSRQDRDNAPTASQTKTLQISLDFGGVDAIAWSPDGRMLATGGERIILWSVPGYDIVHFFKAPGYSMAWSPDGTRLASSDGSGHVRIWDISTGLQIASMGRYISTVAWDRDNDKIAGYMYDYDHGVSAIHFWDTAQFELLSTIPATGMELWNPATDQAVNLENGNVQIWDVETSQIVKEFEGHGIRQHATRPGLLRWSPDGSKVTIPDQNGIVGIWDVSTGQKLLTVGSGTLSPYSEVVWSPDGSMLAINNATGIEIWDAINGQLKFTYPAPSGLNFSNPKWSPDNDKLVAAAIHECPEGWAELWGWDINTNQLLLHERYEYMSTSPGLEWHPNGILLAVIASGVEVQIWIVR